MKKKKKVRKRMYRGNILLSNEEDFAICRAIEDYQKLDKNDPMKKCIDEALNFFTDSPLHIKLFDEVLSNPRGNRVKFCMDNFISEPQIYVYRREIVWRIAMMAYAMKIFTL